MTSSVRWMKAAGCLILLELLLLIPDASASIVTPNDPLLKSQWGWFDVYADRAYNTSYHGQNITVAVLDTGVDTNHPDLKANLILGRNFVTGEDPTNYSDTVGHGTMVAGIIAAVANNSIGIAGVAPLVKIMPLKVLDPTGSFFNIDQAIAYAIANGANVINMSFGSNSTLDPATQNEIHLAYSQGVVLVAAAGNNNSNKSFYPAAYNDSVIPVSALNPSNQKSSYSNYGSYIELAAPGDDICSTYPVNSYKCGSGTSFAAPFVSAVVALMLSKNATLTPSEVRNALNNGAIQLGASGWNQYSGYGLVNACASVSSNCTKSPGWTNGNNIPSLPIQPWVTLLSGFLLLSAVKSKTKRSFKG
jgi:thermitase